MTDEKVVEVLSLYAKTVDDMGYSLRKIEADAEIDMESVPFALSHIRWMCDETKTFITEGRREKAMRWLGFMQGALWLAGVFTLTDLMNHNRPADAPFDAEK